MRELVNKALKGVDGQFASMYADSGRDSVAPEKLMRALLLQVLYSLRSERQIVEQLRYNLLFRWFVGLAMDDEPWNYSVFSKNRDRLIKHEAIEAFFAEVMGWPTPKACSPGRPGYALSQTIRKRIEEHFGWGKTVGHIRQTMFRGLRR